MQNKCYIQAISPFLTMFSIAIYLWSIQIRHCVVIGKPNDRLVQIESTCRQQNTCDSNFEFCFRKGRKHTLKRRKCWLSTFHPFLEMFSKRLFLKGC